MKIFEFKTTDQNSNYEPWKHYENVLVKYNQEFNTKYNLEYHLKSDGTLENCTSYRIIIRSDCVLAGSINITGQNNCCGAMSAHGLEVSYEHCSKGIGSILMTLVTDYARFHSKTSIVCTEIVVNKYETHADKMKENFDINKFYPTSISHKLLLRNDYKLINTFNNAKTNNLVGYFIKTHDVYSKSQVVKIKVNENMESFVKIDKFTIGGDPELFLQDIKTGEYVPSFMVMGGSKEAPLPITDEGHAIQCDNVMVEYNIPPSDNADDFVKHNLFVQDYLKDKIATPNGLELKLIASARFNPENLKDFKALEMGCSPDYNAWNGNVNMISDELIKSNLRTAGGHISVGYEGANYNSNMKLIKFLDLFVSIPLIFMEPDSERKQLYGKAGAFRHTHFGVEYRVTSNYVYSSEEMLRWVYGAVEQAVENYNQKLNITGDTNDIIDAINDKNKTKATALLSKYGIKIPVKQEVK